MDKYPCTAIANGYVCFVWAPEAPYFYILCVQSVIEIPMILWLCVYKKESMVKRPQKMSRCVEIDSAAWREAVQGSIPLRKERLRDGPRRRERERACGIDHDVERERAESTATQRKVWYVPLYLFRGVLCVCVFYVSFMPCFIPFVCVSVCVMPCVLSGNFLRIYVVC